MRQIIIKKNRYVDSVTLMSIGDKILKMEGIENAEVQMGTRANQELLKELGYEIPEGTGADDLVMAVTGDTKAHLDIAIQGMEDILAHRFEEETVYSNLEDVDLEKTPFDLVQISLPGRYAGREAHKALDKGMNVFIFSDNVSLAEERALKEKGRQKDLLVMGPDCGVAMVGGVCLGAGSIQKKGPVGIVAASGSGAQEVACLLEKFGLGISSLIGTGGRDLYPEIGGIEMLQGLEMLAKDSETEAIVLVSKLADYDVMKKVLEAADKVVKPVTAVFLGSDKALFEGHRVRGAFSLEEAACKTAALLMGKNEIAFGYTEEEIESIAEKEMSRYGEKQKYFRGLYCGGTFTEEGLLYYSRIPGIELHSNLNTAYAQKLPDSHVSVGHTILDMGAEDFTAEAPHPVFEPKLRIKRLQKEIDDDETAVILLDFITGPGVASDPFTPFLETVNRNKGRYITYITNICGSLQDPQDIAGKKKMLEEAGIIVTGSSYESARLAGALMKKLEGRKGK